MLSRKSFEKCRKNGEKRILRIQGNLVVPFSEKTAFLSLAERRGKSSSAVVEIVVCFVLLNFRRLFDCNQFQPFSQSNREGVSSSLTNAKNHTFLSFFLEFHQLLRTSRFQISFHISPFQQSSNQKEETKQNKFKTFFANAVEISIISTNLIKITLSQITIQKEWRLVSFCENW